MRKYGTRNGLYQIQWKRHGFVIFLVNQINVCQFEHCALVGLVFGAPWCMKSNFARFTSFLNRAFLCTKNRWSLVGILQQSLWKFIITVIMSDGLFGLYPSSIYSCSIGHIWEHEFCHLGCWAVSEKFLKRRNFCLSMQLFVVVFSTFCEQRNFLKIF